MKTAAKDLKVGDVIEAFPGAFGTAVVSHVGETQARLFRPYATTAGFIHSDNRTICYTGIEEWLIPRNDFAYEVYRSETMKEDII